MGDKRRVTVKDDYTLLLGAGVLSVARGIAKRREDADPGKAKRMTTVCVEKAQLLHEAFPGAVPDRRASVTAVRAVVTSPAWDPMDAKTFVIDLAFADPFAPYEIKYDQGDFQASLEDVAKLVGLPAAFVTEVKDTQKQALKAHRHIAWGKIAVFGLGGAVVMAAGGYALAPWVGGALGGAAGLGGAAATNFGLALLGGGSLAAGGAGVAGGMILVTGVAAGAGFVGGTGAEVMRQLGARGTQAELIKLQTNYKANLLHTQLSQAKAKRVVTDLAKQQHEFEAMLARERGINDRNSQRLKDLEQTLQAIEDARHWMAEQADG